MMSEKEQKEFVKLFSSILRTQNILKSFDEFKEDESSFLNEAQMQDYLSKYTDLHEEFKQARKRQGLEDFTLMDDVVFEMELVEQITVDVDYVINLIHKNREEHKNFKEMEQVISRAINSNPELKLKKELINNFIKYQPPKKLKTNCRAGDPDLLGRRGMPFLKIGKISI